MKKPALLFLFSALSCGYVGAQTSALPGNAINVNGSNQSITVAASASLDFSTGTVEAWVKPTWTSGSPPAGTPCIVGMAANPSSASNTRWSFHINGALSQIGIWNGVTSYFFSYSFSSNTLYHVAAVFSGTTVTIYVNGTSVGSSSGGMNTPSGVSLRIGSSTGTSDYFKGDIDEVRLWNVARTAQQIRESMHLTLTGSETGLVSYYQLNESSGTATSDAKGTNTGTLTNSPARVASTFPLGGGSAFTTTESAGSVSFTGTNFTASYNTSGASSVTTTLIDAAQPNTLPTATDIVSVYSNQYWVVNRFGGSAYNANFRFKTTEDLTSVEAATPAKIQLYYRALNSNGTWSLMSVASAIDDVNDYATFNAINITNPGQLILVKGNILSPGSVSSPKCAGTTATISYDGSGLTFNTGNVFTVQLSNSSGSFSSPANLGMLSSTSNSGSIAITISQYIASGNQYRIRVISSNPARTGVDNGSDIVITNPIDAASFLSTTSGLVAHYPLDGNANDIFVNAYNGTLTGGVTATSDHYGTSNAALNLNGTNSGIDVGDQTNLRMYSAFSISAWVRPATLGSTYTVVTKYYNNESYKLKINNSGQAEIQANNVSVAGTAQSLTLNQWTHIVATVASGNWKIYKDNVQAGSSSASVTLTDSFGAFQIGKDGSAERFPGDIDEVRIYNRVLTAAEVQVLYNNGIASNTGPVCEGSSISLNSLSVTGSPTYSWTGPNSFTSSSQNPTAFSSATPSLSGTYSVSVTKNGCASVPQKTILTVNPIPATPGGTDNGRCSNGTVILTATGSTNGNYRWYTVSSGGTAIGGQVNSTYTTPSLSATTSYWVSQIVNGCESPRKQINAIINTSISTGLTTNGSASICPGTNATINVLSSEASATYQAFKGSTAVSASVSGGGDIALSVPSTNLTTGANTIKVTATKLGCGSADLTNTVNIALNVSITITTQPVNQSSCTGQGISFSVVANGTGLAYQWRKGTTNLGNGGNISGATSATLSLTNLTTGDAGNYNCVISGACPSVTSNDGVLTINTSPAITSQPVNDVKCAGQTSSFSVTATGTSISYQWRKGTTNLGNGGNISGATSATLTLSNVVAGDAGNYNCIISSGAGCNAITSSDGALTVNTAPVITAHPANDTRCAGASSSFSVAATGTGLTFQWRKGTTNLSNGGNISGATSATLSLGSLVAGDAGNYNCVVSGTCSPPATSNNATLTISAGASITAQPMNDAKCAGASTSFSVTATGAGLSYQWRKGTTNLSNSGNISGATSSTLTLSTLAASDAGNYNCIVSASCGSPVTSNDGVLTINSSPNITSQPVDDSRCPGSTSSFSVTAGGVGLSYQWRKGTTNLSNGANISGATSATITISNLSTSDAGNYNCIVSGACAPSVTSNNALLTVNSSAAITAQPADGVFCPGGTANFSLTATGLGLTYQWRTGTTNLNNSGNISGATSATLTVSNISASDVGNYNCVVSSSCGSPVSSANAALTLNNTPTITSQPAGGNKIAGQSITFTIAATGNSLTYRWRKGTTTLADNANINGAATTSLTLSNLVVADAGDYNCVVSSSCENVASNNATLVVDKITPVISLTSTKTSGDIGEELLISATSMSPAAITFSITGGTGQGKFLASGKLLLEKPGTIEVTATQAASSDYNSATAKQSITVSNIITGFEEPLPAFTIYPNPTTGALILEGGNVERISLINMRGVIVREWNIGGITTLDVKDLSSGPYILTGANGNTVVFRKRLIKQ
ncbi:MAG: immunoglobulin domain-containing protein [Bacteroidota bacterium]